MDSMAIFDFLGMTKEMDLEDGSKQKVFDEKSFKEKMGNVGEVGREIGLYNQPAPSSPAVYGPKAISSPAPLPMPAGNPYGGMSPAMMAIQGAQTNQDAMMMQQMAPQMGMRGSYGPMTDRDAMMMRQGMPSGIGMAPSMEQIIRQMRGGY